MPYGRYQVNRPPRRTTQWFRQATGPAGLNQTTEARFNLASGYETLMGIPFKGYTITRIIINGMIQAVAGSSGNYVRMGLIVDDRSSPAKLLTTDLFADWLWYEEFYTNVGAVEWGAGTFTLYSQSLQIHRDLSSQRKVEGKEQLPYICIANISGAAAIYHMMSVQMLVKWES